MGLIKALTGAVGGVLSDQWKEYFYCESMEADVLVQKGQKRISGRSTNRYGENNIISNGSAIAVADGQCMIIVEQGKIVEVCAEPGTFTYDTSTEPSIFYGDLGTNIKETFKNIGKRFTYGGSPGNDQRVYYFNTKEILGNKYGTVNPITYKFVDEYVGIKMAMSLKCNGEYSYRITDPILFYTNVCDNVDDEYRRNKIDSQLKSELITALMPAFGQFAQKGMDYTDIPLHSMELADILNNILSEKWSKLRGISIVSLGINSLKASDEDEAELKRLQRARANADPSLRAGLHGVATASALEHAAQNEGQGGAFMAFAGMNMANQSSANAQMNEMQMQMQQMQMQLQQQQQQNQMQQNQMQQNVGGGQAPAANSWTCECGTSNTGKFCASCGKPKPAPAGVWKCSCGTENTGKFCANCGKPKPEEQIGWTCVCGAVNKGKFCAECGAPKPKGAPVYKCDKCGWEPKDTSNPPKFCPECGDVFDDNDIQ